MATSTYFGWAEPDDTDLVKNGASAMRTLGNAIDASLYNYNGRNPLINSNFSVFQRGTSVSVSASTAVYTADRWTLRTNANQASTVSQQNTSDTTNLPNIRYCARVQRNSGQTGAIGTIEFVQSMETNNSIPYAGKQVTLSFYARKGANYSATSDALTIYLISGTGTDQSRNGASTYTGEAFPINSQTATLTTTWQRFTYTGTVAATATELATYFGFTPTGTAGAADYFEITGVQLDIGSVALPYKPNASTQQGELAACQRYYYRVSSDATQVWAQLGFGSATSTTNALCNLPLKVSLRVVPTSVDYANLCVTPDGLASYPVVSSATLVTSSYMSKDSVAINLASTGLTQYRPYWVHSYNNSNGYLGLNAEL